MTAMLVVVAGNWNEEDCRARRKVWGALLKYCFGGFLGFPMVKSLPCSAGDTGSIPDRGIKILHVAGQLSLRSATAEPACISKDAA